ncbi:hypothetical protein ACLOJK_034022 [Asimina triloba]
MPIMMRKKKPITQRLKTPKASQAISLGHDGLEEINHHSRPKRDLKSKDTDNQINTKKEDGEFRETFPKQIQTPPKHKFPHYYELGENARLEWEDRKNQTADVEYQETHSRKDGEIQEQKPQKSVASQEAVGNIEKKARASEHKKGNPVKMTYWQRVGGKIFSGLELSPQPREGGKSEVFRRRNGGGGGGLVNACFWLWAKAAERAKRRRREGQRDAESCCCFGVWIGRL